MNFRIIGLPGDRTPDPFASTVDPFAIEVSNLQDALAAHAIPTPGDISATDLIQVVGAVYAPGQFPPVSYLGISPAAKEHVTTATHPALKRFLSTNSPDAFSLGTRIGHCLAAGHDGRRFNSTFPMDFGANNIQVDGASVPYAIETGQVVEYGLGINGLLSHIQNLRANRYNVVGIHRSRAEAALLKGMAEGLGVADRTTLESGGIKKNLEPLLRRKVVANADLVVASRVHAAGEDLRPGIAKLPAILRAGGLFIARGPRAYAQGINYDEVANATSKVRGLEIRINRLYDEVKPSGFVEPNRLIVAAKK